MKKKIIACIAAALVICFSGCRQSTRVSYNVSKEADNFNVLRRIVVINSRTDKLLFELVGQFSIENNSSDELSIICQTGENEYKKHLIYLNQYTLYTVEDLGGADVSPYKYEVNFLPEMIQPVTITSSY